MLFNLQIKQQFLLNFQLLSVRDIQKTPNVLHLKLKIISHDRYFKPVFFYAVLKIPWWIFKSLLKYFLLSLLYHTVLLGHV